MNALIKVTALALFLSTSICVSASASTPNYEIAQYSNPNKSSRHGSVSETTAMNTDRRTYAKYETQLINMMTGVDDYNDARRRDIQRKMRQIRTKWEQRGYNFPHSEMEHWRGN